MPFLPPNQQRHSTEGIIHILNSGKIENSAAEFAGSTVHAALCSDPLGELIALS